MDVWLFFQLLCSLSLPNDFVFLISYQHDPKDDTLCTPGGEQGNYIMFAHATSGDKGNNNRFSPCSLRSIYQVLKQKAINSKGCFMGKAS